MVNWAKVFRGKYEQALPIPLGGLSLKIIRKKSSIFFEVFIFLTSVKINDYKEKTGIILII